jgi:hypothetical protein
MKQKINELPTDSKNKNILVHGFKMGYRPRTNLVKDENIDLLAYSHILYRWKNYFSPLLTVYRVNDIRQMEIQLTH